MNRVLRCALLESKTGVGIQFIKAYVIVWWWWTGSREE